MIRIRCNSALGPSMIAASLSFSITMPVLAERVPPSPSLGSPRPAAASIGECQLEPRFLIGKTDTTDFVDSVPAQLTGSPAKDE